MSKKRDYTIIVRRERVVVSYDIYKAYHKERERARYLENEAREHEIPMEWLEDHGVHPKHADTTPSPLDIIIHQEQMAKLREALHSLSADERSLIHALFFEHKSERQVAAERGSHHMTVHNRKRKILKKLRNHIEK